VSDSGIEADQGAGDKPQQRREPTQARSRARVEAILDAAEAAIGTNGVAGTTMSAIAERAEVSMASVYQYFPDLKAVIWAMSERFNAEVRADLPELLSDISGPEDARERISAAVTEYHQRFSGRLGLRAIWTSSASDPELAAQNLADSRANGRAVAAALRDVSDLPAPELDRRAFLVAQMTGAAVAMAALTGDPEGDELIQTFARIAADSLVPSS
jgi:AcrR family transcriptional regulator